MTDFAIDLQGVWKRFYLRRQWTLQEAAAALLRRENAHLKNSFWALADLNLQVKKGETIGIIGANGAGKSTLLKMLAGMMAPNRGCAIIRGQVAPLLSLYTGLAPHLTGRENIFLTAAIMGQTRAQISAQLPTILDFAGLGDFIDQPVKTYSAGMYARLAFAIVIGTPFEILLIDELLAVGDLAFQKRCYQKLHQFQQQGKTIILISHNGDEIQEFCDHVLYLEEGKTIAYGEPAATLKLYWQAPQSRRKFSRH